MIRQASNYLKVLQKHLIIDDLEAVKILMAITVAHKVTGVMLWVRLVGTSGSGKTELLNSLSDLDGYCERIESLTPAAIRRGFVPDNKEKLKTLLDRINGKLVVTKELAPILTTSREAKKELFGLLRSVHDGTLVADYGSKQGYIVQEVDFDWIAASTVLVDREAALEAFLGSRFINLRWGPPLDRRLAIAKAVSNNGKFPEIRRELATAMKELVDSVNLKGFTKVQFDNSTYDLGDFVARYRTPVIRDRQKKDYITEIPDPEMGTRVGQYFERIANGLKLIGITDYKPYLQRLALDCLHPLRGQYIRGRLAGYTTQEALANYMKVCQASVHYVEEDCKYLGFVPPYHELDLFTDVKPTKWVMKAATKTTVKV